MSKSANFFLSTKRKCAFYHHAPKITVNVIWKDFLPLFLMKVYPPLPPFIIIYLFLYLIFNHFSFILFWIFFFLHQVQKPYLNMFNFFFQVDALYGHHGPPDRPEAACIQIICSKTVTCQRKSTYFWNLKLNGTFFHLGQVLSLIYCDQLVLKVLKTFHLYANFFIHMSASILWMNEHGRSIRNIVSLDLLFARMECNVNKSKILI